jgi:hypothetical protein
MFQPFAYYKTEVATLAPPPGITLPSGAIVVYNFANAASWPGSGRFVYDLSGNNFTGSMTGSIGSGSAGGVSFNEALAMIQVGNGNTAFYSAFDDKKQMYLGLQYETGSMSANTSFISTWGTNSDNNQNFGYAFFINGGSPASDTRTGVQLYNAGGTGAQGYYNEPAKPGWITGSVATLGMMLNITSGSYKLYNNNTNIATKTGINTSLFTSYGTANGDAGKGFRLGNRYGEPFRGQFKKFVAYNRALSDAELATIEAWMTGSN